MSGGEFPSFVGNSEQPDMVAPEGPAVENIEPAPEGADIETAWPAEAVRPASEEVGDITEVSEPAPEELGDGIGINGPVAREEEAPTDMEKIKLSDRDRDFLLNSETPDIVGHLGKLKAAGISGDEIANVLADRSELEDNLSELSKAGFDVASIISKKISPIRLAKKFKELTEELGVPGEIIVDALLKSSSNEETIFEGLLKGEAPLEILAQYTPESFITQVASGREGINPNVNEVALAFNSLLAKNKPHVPDNGQDEEMFEREYGDSGDSTAATERIRIVLENVGLVEGPDGKIASGLVKVDTIMDTAPDGFWRSLTKEEAQRLIDLGVKTGDIYERVINCPVVFSERNVKFDYGDIWERVKRSSLRDPGTIEYTELEEGDKLDYAWFSGHGLSDQQMVDFANKLNRRNNFVLRQMPIEKKFELCRVTL